MILSKARLLAKSEKQEIPEYLPKKRCHPLRDGRNATQQRKPQKEGGSPTKGRRKTHSKERGRPTTRSACQQRVNSISNVNSVNSCMNCMYFSANSMLNKRNELKVVIGEQNPLVIGVTEVVPTNCKVQTQETKLVTEKYKCFENLNCAKRGVCIYTHQSFGATECREMTGRNGDESIWCEAKLMKNYKLLIGCIYRSSNSNVTNDAKIYDTLKKTNNLGFSHVLIFGDLNHPSLNWRENTSPPDGNHPSTIFMEAVRESFLTQHVIEPTHYRGNNSSNTLDLIFTNEEGMIEKLKYLAPLGKSHHSLLNFNFCCYTKSIKSRVNKYRYDKGNYKEMK